MKALYIIVSLLALSACDSEKVEVLKSPCVSLDETCGPKRPANEWLVTSKQA